MNHAPRDFLATTATLLGPLGLLSLLLFLLVYVGVVLPAIWSRVPARRTAAHRVLSLLLEHFHRMLRALRGLWTR
ncbi:hypothetical protein [Embleya sp. AB8]|uniref:hypothetical protein n=1 Tax=Embleya sp. AB8 TaxID=3156304 RepID=UPI003C77CE7B